MRPRSLLRAVASLLFLVAVTGVTVALRPDLVGVAVTAAAAIVLVVPLVRRLR